ISQVAQNSPGGANILVADEKIQIPKLAEAKVAIGFQCKDRPFDRNCIYAAPGQGFENARKLCSEPRIRPADIVEQHPKGVDDVFVHRIGRDMCERMTSETCQPMIDCRLCEEWEVDSGIERLPDDLLIGMM